MADHVLVIGAQKCGTTTLFEDLRSHPDITLAPKESALLLSATSATDYWSHFEPGARLTGEVATDYAMLPRIDAATVAQRYAPDAHIVYIVRDPVQRVLSHHHHLLAEGRVSTDLATALTQEPSMVDNSRYAFQLAPWMRAFGRDQVHVIRFEDYMADRQEGFDGLCRFLDAAHHELARPEVAHNTAERKRVATGGWRRLRESGSYQRVIRPLLSENLRRRIGRSVLPKPPPRPQAPDSAVVAQLVMQLEPEVASLAAMLGSPTWWTLEEPDSKGVS